MTGGQAMTLYTHPNLPGFHGNAAFALDGIQYLRSWWRTVTAQEIAALGFVEYTPPEPDPQTDPVPHEVSRRQLLTGLALVGWITQQEAIDAISTGAMPTGVASLIDAIEDETEQFAARMKWAGFQTAYRDDPLVLALATVEGKTEEEVDDFFRLCAEIE